MKNKTAILVMIFVGFFILSCGESTIKSEADVHEEHPVSNSVSLSELQIKTLDLKIIPLEEKNMSQAIQVTGNLELAPQDKADISPLMGGIVKKIYVIEGDKVKKGQTLALMQHPDFVQLQEDYSIAKNNLEYTKKEYLRTKKLFEEKVSSEANYQKTKAAYYSNKSKVASLKIKLNMLGLSTKNVEAGNISSSIRIVSPFSGTVSLVETNVGAFAEPMSKLFEVVNNAKLHADFMVYEKDINKVQVGQKVFFNTASVAGKEFEGEIHAISPVFEENPKALHVHADISNKTGKLIPGMYINGRIIADNALTKVAPDDAIVADNGKFYIFVKTKNQVSKHDHDEADDHDHEEATTNFAMVEVLIGMKNAGFSEIKLLNNLPENVEIAGSGAYFLLAEMRKGETEHSH